MDIGRLLLPHVTDTSVATDLFTRTDLSSLNDPLALATELDAVPDGVSRDGGWAKAATEAVHTSSPERLERLARYPQKKVRRAVAGNPAIDVDDLAYLIGWANDKDDDDLLATAIHSQPLDKLLEAVEHPVALIRYRGLPRRLAAALVEKAPAALLRRLFTDPQLVGVATAVVDYLRRPPADATPALSLLELVEPLDQPLHPDVGRQIWSTHVVDLDEARLRILQLEHAPDRPSSVNASTVAVDAAHLLVHHDPLDARLVASALPCSRALETSAYDRVLDLLEYLVGPDAARPAKADLAYLVGQLGEDHHLAALDRTQVARLLDVLEQRVAQKAAAGDTIGYLEMNTALRSFRLCGPHIDEDQAASALGWLNTEVLSDWSREHSIPGTRWPVPTPRLIDIVARQALGQGRDGAINSDVVLNALTYFDAPEQHALRDTLLDALGTAVFNLLGRRQVASAVADRLQREFGSDLERWNAATGLMKDWDAGGLSELVEVAHTLCGGRPEPIAPDDDVEVEEVEVGLATQYRLAFT